MNARIYRDEIKPEDLRQHVPGWLDVTIEDRISVDVSINGDTIIPKDAPEHALPNPVDFVYEGRVRHVILANSGDVVISKFMLTKLVSGVSGVTFTGAEAFVDALVRYT